MPADDDPIEFDCCDCGRHVIAFGFHAQVERCNCCFWITRHVSPKHEAEVREHLGVPLVTRH